MMAVFTSSVYWMVSIPHAFLNFLLNTAVLETSKERVYLIFFWLVAD